MITACHVDFILEDIRTGKSIRQIIEFPDTMTAQKWVEQKTAEWVNSHRILSPVIRMGGQPLCAPSHALPEPLLERYSESGAF